MTYWWRSLGTRSGQADVSIQGVSYDNNSLGYNLSQQKKKKKTKSDISPETRYPPAIHFVLLTKQSYIKNGLTNYIDS